MLVSSHQMILSTKKWDMRAKLCPPKANRDGECSALEVSASRHRKLAWLSKAPGSG